jgi:hypothetical protein
MRQSHACPSSSWLRLEKAFLSAFFERDGTTARSIVNEIGPLDRPSELALWRTEAAIRICEHDSDGALEALSNANRFIDEIQPEGIDDVRDLLTELEARARALSCAGHPRPSVSRPADSPRL